ncbi:MAG: nuclease-related domain-containing protein, partial [Betaproteobacteria bacterium]
MNGYPDFVLFHPRRGLLIIEVKDWKRDTIGRLDRYQATLLVDGREKRAPNSLEQARECAIAMELACRFAREVLSPKEADEDGIPLLAPESAGRRGERPQLLRFGDEAAE